MRSPLYISLITACLLVPALWANAVPLQGGVQEFDPGPSGPIQGGATDTFDIDVDSDQPDQPVQGRRRGGIRFSPPRINPNSRCGSDQENINRISARFGTGPVRVPAERVGWPGYHYAYCGIDYCNLNTKVLCWKHLDEGPPQEAHNEGDWQQWRPATDAGGGEGNDPNRPPITIGGRTYAPDKVIADNNVPRRQYAGPMAPQPDNTSPLPPFPLSTEEWNGNPADLGLPTPPPKLIIDVNEDNYPKPKAFPPLTPQTPKKDPVPKTPKKKGRIHDQSPPKKAVGYKEGAGCLPDPTWKAVDFFHLKLSNSHQQPGEAVGGPVDHFANHYNFVWVDGRIWRDKVKGDRFEVLRAWRRAPMTPKVVLYEPGSLFINLHNPATYQQKMKNFKGMPCQQ